MGANTCSTLYGCEVIQWYSASRWSAQQTTSRCRHPVSTSLRRPAFCLFCLPLTTISTVSGGAFLVQSSPAPTTPRPSARIHSVALRAPTSLSNASPLTIYITVAAAPPAARRHIAPIIYTPSRHPTTTTHSASITNSCYNRIDDLLLSRLLRASSLRHPHFQHTTTTTTTMFDDNFSFAFSRSPSWASSNASSTREPSRSVSPCSPLSAFPPPPQRYSVTDLAADLDRQRIRPEARIHYQSCDSYANTTDDDSAWELPPLCSDSEADSTYSGSITTTTSYSASLSRARITPTRSYSPTRRVQRQSGTRLLCASQNHAKDIAELLSRMVSSSEQCSIVAPPDAMPSQEEADDEGYNSGNGGGETATSSRRGTISSKRSMDFRRARKSVGAAAIAKDVRFRGTKDKGHRRHRSSGEKTAVV